MKTLRDVMVIVATLAALAGVIYGGYWIAKRVSYALFYGDMVEDTVRRMVKPEALK